ncbi:MAG TPA: hypothetical protein PKD70_11250, partial [Saprospiraceae bacterium]|nr:hypothetical protein [Saprospiraceae bacterium]
MNSYERLLPNRLFTFWECRRDAGPTLQQHLYESNSDSAIHQLVLWGGGVQQSRGYTFRLQRS